MNRKEILSQIEQAFGSVPGWLDGAPDAVLAQAWGLVSWILEDTKLSSRDKALVAFGTAAGIHCEY